MFFKIFLFDLILGLLFKALYIWIIVGNTVNNNIKGWANNYETVCKTLKKHHLFKDHGREFGRGWNYWPIPSGDLAKIVAMIKEIDEQKAN